MKCPQLAAFQLPGDMFGYTWIRGELDPSSGLRLHWFVVVSLIGLFGVCFFMDLPEASNLHHLAGLAIGMTTGFLLAVLAPTPRGFGPAEPTWDLPVLLRDHRRPMSHPLALGVTLTAVVVASVWGVRESSARTTFTGERVYFWAQRCIRQKLETNSRYTFSAPDSDPATGWEQVASNRWHLHGVLLLESGPRADWQAEVEGQGLTPRMTFLKVANQVLITNGAVNPSHP